MEINELVQKSHQMAKEKGFWDDWELENPKGLMVSIKPNIPEKLALIHSEISEALEEYRSGANYLYLGIGNKPEGLGAELADTVIRIADLCGYLNLDLSEIIELKMIYNSKRPYKHGKAF